MNGKTVAYSRLPSILAEHRWTVAEFIKKLGANGVALDKKTVYRLASPKPIETINARVLGAVCAELKIGIGEIITWQQPKPELHRIDEKTQARLSWLMSKNNEGRLNPGEARELAELGAYAEKLSLENARILAALAGTKKMRAAPAAGKRPVPERKARPRPERQKKVAV